MSEEQKTTTHAAAFSKEDIDKNKGMAIVAYILFFVPLLTEAKDSPFVKFHVKQAIVLIISSIVVSILGTIIPIIGWILAPIISLVLFVFWIMGIMNAVNGEAKQVPVVGKYADQYLKF